MGTLISNIIIIAILAVIFGLVISYIIKAKKKGVKCIGCPDSASCANSGGNCPSTLTHDDTEIKANLATTHSCSCSGGKSCGSSNNTCCGCKKGSV